MAERHRWNLLPRFEKLRNSTRIGTNVSQLHRKSSLVNSYKDERMATIGLTIPVISFFLNFTRAPCYFFNSSVQ